MLCQVATNVWASRTVKDHWVGFMKNTQSIKERIADSAEDPGNCGVRLYKVSINLGDLPYFEVRAEAVAQFDSTKLRNVNYHRDHIVDRFPLLFCLTRVPDSLEMNLFLEHRYRGKFLPPKRGGRRNLLGGVTLETLYSIANSLRGFLAWLVKANADWREIYAAPDSEKAKAWLPPYRYRMALIERISNNEISRDTANLYLSHIRQFYEWALTTRRIERVPFKYKFIAIKKHRQDGDFDLLFSSALNEKALLIQTSDLVIPKRYRSKQEAHSAALTPFNATELRWMLNTHYMRLSSRRLWAELAYACGLRAKEIATLAENIVVNPTLSGKAFFEVKVLGKFNKERRIVVPLRLMESLWQFKNSPERLHRAGLWDLASGTHQARPLFLNRSGKAINSASITNVTSYVAKELKHSDTTFNRSFHDLRATFATALAKFMLEKQMPLGFIQYRLMALMGHANFSTTQKYINFARTITFEHQMEGWVEQVFGGLRSSFEDAAHYEQVTL